MKNPAAENGNVLFIILIAVALFGALSYAVTSSSRGGGKGGNEEQAQLLASELLNYAAALKGAYTRLNLGNGCGDNEISFEINVVDSDIWNYANSRSPDDYSCHMFHPKGGGMHYKVLSEDFIGNLEDANTPTQASFDKARYPLFAGHSTFGTGGNDVNGDIFMIVSYLNKAVCDAIDNRINVTPEYGTGGVLFYSHPLGPYPSRSVGGYVGGLHTKFHSFHYACIKGTFPGETTGYQFYYVIKTIAP